MKSELFHNGTIIALDEENRTFSAMLIEDGIIKKTGNSWREWNLPEKTAITDLKGKAVIPGFNDNHIHLNFLGESLSEPDLKGLDEKQILELLEKSYPAPSRGEIITGSGWDYPACSAPRKEMLDRLFPKNPVILAQYGGHACWVNSLVLRKMKVSGETPDSAMGILERDGGGDLTGVVRDFQQNPYMEKLFIRRLLDFRRIESNYRASLERCREYGITSVQDNTWSFVAVMVMNRLFRKKLLTARISCWSFGMSPLFVRLLHLMKFRTGFYEEGPAKFFIDGTFTARTAWLKEPYADDETSCGIGTDKEKIINLIRPHIGRKHQVAFHAIGDRAVCEFLDALEELEKEFPYIPRMRIRIEHGQLISPEDMERIKRLGLVVCAQPSALNNPEKDRLILGRARAEKAYPYRSLIDRGITLSFGSDAPGESTLNPFEAISFAVNREGAERINVLEALKCYSSGSAFAEFKEMEKGILSPGRVADFLVLSDDPLAIPAGNLNRIKVLETYLGGRLITPGR